MTIIATNLIKSRVTNRNAGPARDNLIGTGNLISSLHGIQSFDPIKHFGRIIFFHTDFPYEAITFFI